MWGIWLSLGWTRLCTMRVLHQGTGGMGPCVAPPWLTGRHESVVLQVPGTCPGDCLLLDREFSWTNFLLWERKLITHIINLLRILGGGGGWPNLEARFSSILCVSMFVCLCVWCVCVLVSVCYHTVWCVLHNPVRGKRKVKHDLYSSCGQNKCLHYMWIVSTIFSRSDTTASIFSARAKRRLLFKSGHCSWAAFVESACTWGSSRANSMI